MPQCSIKAKLLNHVKSAVYNGLAHSKQWDTWICTPIQDLMDCYRVVSNQESLSSKFGIYWKIINYFKVTVTTKYKPNQGKSSHVIIWQKKKVTPKSQNKESQLWLHILCKTKQFKTCYFCSCGKCFLCSAHKIHPVVESGDTTMKPNVVLRVHQRCSQVIKKNVIFVIFDYQWLENKITDCHFRLRLEWGRA